MAYHTLDAMDIEVPPSRKIGELTIGGRNVDKGYRRYMLKGEAEIAMARHPDAGDPLELFSDASSLRRLPLPGPAELFNTERFSLTGNTFEAYGREMFGDLWIAVETVERKQGHLIYFHGCLGVGKSHLLASFAVQILNRGRRVAFLPDCRAVLANPHMALHRAFRLAFVGDEESQEEIDSAQTLDELRQIIFFLCAGLDTPLILIVDQCNALDDMPEAADRTSNATKKIVLDFLNNLTLVVTKIESSSGNYVHGKNFARRSIDEHRISLFTGLTPREMTSWWASSGKMLYNILHEDDRIELESFTGCLPFLLKVFSDINWDYLKEDAADASGIAKHEYIADDFKSGTLYEALITAMYEEFYKSKRASNVTENLVKHVQDSFRDTQKDPRFAIRLRDAIMACLCNQKVSDLSIIDDIDSRFCYLDESKIGNVSANWFRDIYFRELRDVRGVETKLSPSWTETLTVGDARNRSVLGFKVENQVLTYINEHGFSFDEHFSKPPHGHHFFKEFVESMFDRRELFMLYIPSSSSYASVDAILVSRYFDTNEKKEKVLTASVIGLQITIGKRHGDKEIQYLKSTSDWADTLGVQKVLHTYVYLWENIPKNKLPAEHIPKKTRGTSNNIVHPTYTRLHLRIRDLSEKIGVNLEDISTKMRQQMSM